MRFCPPVKAGETASAEVGMPNQAIRIDTGALEVLSGSILNSDLEIGEASFSSCSGRSDAAAAHDHDACVTLYSNGVGAHRDASQRDAEAIREVARVFSERDAELARAFTVASPGGI